MTKTKAKPAGHFGSLEEADGALHQIALAERDAQIIKAQLDKDLAALKEERLPGISLLLATAAGLRADLENSAAEHPEWFLVKRSAELAHGAIGWHLVPFVKLLKKVESVVAALKCRKLLEAVIVKESPNKDVLATYDDETLAAVGAKKCTKNEFFIRLAEVRTPEPKTV
jgi:phage host-nuclease inhibitor protein Gam